VGGVVCSRAPPPTSLGANPFPQVQLWPVHRGRNVSIRRAAARGWPAEKTMDLWPRSLLVCVVLGTRLGRYKARRHKYSSHLRDRRVNISGVTAEGRPLHGPDPRHRAARFGTPFIVHSLAPNLDARPAIRVTSWPGCVTSSGFGSVWGRRANIPIRYVLSRVGGNKGGTGFQVHCYLAFTF